MANLAAPEQNRLLAQLASLLRGREEVQAQMNPTMMGALMDLILPSAQTVEKLSYGDPMFRMPPSGTGGYIPITTDKQYAAELIGMSPAIPAASRATARISNEAADQLVRAITRNPEATAPAALEAAGQMAPLSRIFRPEQVKSVLPETKVVDEAGNPKMLYHGTNKEYEEFSESALGTKTGNPTSKIGFFFSESPSEGSRYASDWGKEGGNVRPVYLDIKNPKRLTYKEMNDISMAMFDDSSSLPVNAWKTKEGQKAIVESKEKGIKRANQMAMDLRERLISEGYDGAVVKIGGMDEYIAFSPDQIKSAISDPSFAGLLDEPAQSVEKIYHGTSPQAAKQIEKAGFDITKSADGSVWFTNNPDIGEVSATGKGAVVERLADINKLKLGGWEETDKFSTNELIQKGFDGLRLVDGDTVTYQIFNPEKLQKAIK
jgi:hypothetical protein